jgi:magnesium transporter
MTEPQRRTGEPGLLERVRRLAAAPARLPRVGRGLLGGLQRSPLRKPPPGAQPGALHVPEGAPAPQMTAMIWDADRLEERRLDGPEDVAALPLGDGRVAWIDLDGFGDEAVLQQVGAILGIHPLALADIVHVPQRPKAEMHGDRLLVIAQMASVGAGGAIEVEQVSLVLGPGWVATFQEWPGDVFEPVRVRIRSRTARICSEGPDYLAYALLDAIVDGYFPVVEALGAAIEELEEEVIEKPTPDTLARIHATRRTLLHLHRVQWRQRDALGSLLRADEFPFGAAVRPYLRDAHDHAFQTLDAMDTQRELVVGLLDVYLSNASNRLNEVMKTLTVVATVFIPLTFLVGVYGMNFEHMPELHWRWGYPAVWGVMLAVVAGLLLWFRRRGWLGDGRTRPAGRDPR